MAREMISIEKRFWAKVQKAEGCWPWMAFRMKNGYGTIGVGRREEGKKFAHRVSWEIHFGPIPDGLHVLHRCDTPFCVRPDHLWLGTDKDNSEDREKKGRGNRYNQAKGESNGRAKLAIADVVAIREMKGSTRKIGALFGVTDVLISKIKNRKLWTHVA